MIEVKGMKIYRFLFQFGFSTLLVGSFQFHVCSISSSALRCMLPVPESVSKVQEMTKSVTLQIETIVDSLLEGVKADTSFITTLHPQVIVDNAHVLAKGRLYESVIAKKLNGNSTVTHVDQVDSLLRGFVTSERKRRSRLKVDYLLAGAASQRLEDGVKMLVDR